MPTPDEHAAKLSDWQLTRARNLADEIRNGHPDFGHTPDEELSSWQREVKSLWALNLQSVLSGFVAALLAEIDRLQEQHERAETLLARLNAIKALKVTTNGDDCIHVDASPLASGEQSSEHCELLDCLPDTGWTHGPSGTSGTLGEMLHGIASCYLDRASPEHFGGAVTDATVEQLKAARRPVGIDACAACGHAAELHATDDPARPCVLTTRDDEGRLIICDCDEFTRGADATVGEDSEHG